ncbi:MAG TPA: hypothetical protein VKB93_03705 [Thermoanaerobaculia bacterium]|nr:hypothetical protein [Thermoanaerobaculia bacterium]
MYITGASDSMIAARVDNDGETGIPPDMAARRKVPDGDEGDELRGPDVANIRQRA